MSRPNFARISLYTLAALAALPASARATGLFDAGIPAGWTCFPYACSDPANTTAGTSTAAVDGVVSLPPSSSSYGWVSTYDPNATGPNGGSPFPSPPGSPSGGGAGGNQNGSWVRSTAFGANAGDALNFQFNYVTSDGGTYADYAWARLLNADTLAPVDVIFTARTSSDTAVNPIPGFGLPALGATTLTVGGSTVASVPLINTGYIPSSAGDPSYPLGLGPVWSPLGSAYDGTCWDIGCGYTGWVSASYALADAGNYILEFGVTNWDDTAWDRGWRLTRSPLGAHPLRTTRSPSPQRSLCSVPHLRLGPFLAAASPKRESAKNYGGLRPALFMLLLKSIGRTRYIRNIRRLFA